MDSTISFKERVRQVAISEASHYKRVFIDYDYLICCKNFSSKKYYIITSEEDNYAHLLGVDILCSPKDFFNKCITGKLVEGDFDFLKKRQKENDVKGTVRRKINSLDKMKSIFDGKIFIEESFMKNNVVCAIAATDLRITIGFSSGDKSYPKTLLKGNELSGKSVEPTIILRKKKNDSYFDDVIYGTKDDLELFINDINHLLQK